MKRVIGVGVATVLFAAALVGCSDTKSTSESAESSAAPEPVTTETEAPVETPLWTASECEEFLRAFQDSKVFYLREMRDQGVDLENWESQDYFESRLAAAEELLKANRVLEAAHSEGSETKKYMMDVASTIRFGLEDNAALWAFDLYDLNRGSYMVDIPQITDVTVAAIGSSAANITLWDSIDAFTCD